MAEVAGAYSESGSPEIMEETVKTGETFIEGAVLIYDTGTVAEGGSNPTVIVGVACAKAGSAPGYDAANSPSVFTWRENTISVYKANSDKNIFVSPLCNNTTDSTKATPAAADKGVQYGITKQATGNSTGAWWVDKNKTTTSARVEIVKIDIDNKLVHWKFLQEFTTNE